MMRPVKALALALACSAITLAAASPASQRPSSTDSVRIVQVQHGFYMLAGAGGNITVQIGPDGVVLVDSGSGTNAAAAVDAIRKLTDQPIRYIINTSADAEHVGGNEVVAKAGQSLFSAGNLGPGGNGGISAINNGGGASIIGTETQLNRMSTPIGALAPYPAVAWPTETFTRRQKTLYLNGEGIQVIRQPAAHSDADSVVLFRRSDVIVTGDVFDTTRFPVVDLDHGGTIQGEIDALNALVELAIPSVPLPWREGGTIVIPGHGRVCEQAELVEYRDMVTIVRDRVKDLIAKNQTLDAIKTANPTKGFRARYGADAGPWTTDMFVEAIYKSLTAAKRP
jgi:glyoxylase-like metal-dependent hydrolase (beta-lactamase superfamily II)